MTRAARRRLMRAFALAAGLLALALAVRLVVMAFAPPPPPVPEAWMTPRYVQRTWAIPPDRLAEILRVERGSAPATSLAEIARQTGRPVADILADLRAEIAAGTPPP